jgi:hypothetical protein
MRKKDEKEREMRRCYLEAVAKIIAPDRDAKAMVEEVMRENPQTKTRRIFEQPLSRKSQSPQTLLINGPSLIGAAPCIL